MRDFKCYMFIDINRKDADSVAREILAWAQRQGFVPSSVDTFRTLHTWREYGYTDDGDAAKRTLSAPMFGNVQGSLERGPAGLSFWGNRAKLQMVVISLGSYGYLRLVERAGIIPCKEALRELAARCQPLAIICGRELTLHREEYVSGGIKRRHLDDWRHFWRDLTARRRLPLLLHYNLISRRIPLSDPKSREIVSKASVVGDYWEIDEWAESAGRCEEAEIQRIRRY